MVTRLLLPGALGIVIMLFWGTVVTSFACFLTDRYLRSLLKARWKLLISCIALVMLWRIPMDGQFFHGTEYEDSYIYTVVGRQMAEHIRIKPNGAALPYSINVCAVGSLTSCRQYDNYPEHLIGYPYILSLFSRIFGYKPSIGSIVNVACSCLADIFIFIICMVISDDLMAASSAALIFAITPVFAVWGLETSAEPVSNLCMSLVLWLCLRCVSLRLEHGDRMNALITWCAFTVTLLFSLTVKRENILLFIVLPIVAVFMHFRSKSSHSTPIRNPWWIVVSAILAFFFSLHVRIYHSMSDETTLLNRFPLTFTEYCKLLPVFLHSFFIVQWYGGAVFLVLVGAITVCRRKTLGLIPFSLFAAYVVLYAFHVRSYYEMQSGSTDSRTALRFSMSLMSVWSILAGLGAASLFKWVRRTRIWKSRRGTVNWITACSLVLIAGVSYFTTRGFRNNVVEDEFRMRIEPSLTALRVATSGRTTEKENYIVTFEPLILQMYAEPEVNVLSFYYFNDTTMNEIGFPRKVPSILYLDEQIHRTPADAERYKGQLDYLSHFQRTTQMDNTLFSVSRLSLAPAGNKLPQGY